MTVPSGPGRQAQARSRCARPGLDWILMGAALALFTIGTLLVWSATSSATTSPAATPRRTSASSWSTS